MFCAAHRWICWMEDGGPHGGVPFIQIQFATRNQFQGLVWCKFGHVTFTGLNHRNLRTPQYGDASPEGAKLGGGGRLVRFRANMAHIRQSRRDSGLVCQREVLICFQAVPSSLGSGHTAYLRCLETLFAMTSP